ncbi:MAG TPA: hypothetical protein VFT66_16915 [Roseiflexaceae bacterium]|nr:hypothetical protein [Roseiflexaceae bacterium]
MGTREYEIITILKPLPARAAADGQLVGRATTARRKVVLKGHDVVPHDSRRATFLVQRE